MGDYLASNHEEIVILRKHLTDMTHKLFLDVIGSVEYHKELRSLFDVRELTKPRVSIGSDLSVDTFEFLSITLLVKLPPCIVHNHEVSVYQTCWGLGHEKGAGALLQVYS